MSASNSSTSTNLKSGNSDGGYFASNIYEPAQYHDAGLARQNGVNANIVSAIRPGICSHFSGYPQMYDNPAYVTLPQMSNPTSNSAMTTLIMPTLNRSQRYNSSALSLLRNPAGLSQLC